MNEQLEEFVRACAPLIGRILIAIVFLLSAWGKLTGFEQTAAAMGGKGMPMPEVLLVCAIVIELGGAAMLLLGWHARLTATALAVFLVVASLYFHNYWSYPQAEQRNQRNHFMKNVGFVGGLLVIIGLGAGPVALDNRRRRIFKD